MKKALLYFSARQMCSREVLILATNGVLDLQQQHRFTSLLVSVLRLLGPVQLRCPTPPPKPCLWSGLFRVAAGSTNMDGTACSASCSNNVQ